MPHHSSSEREVRAGELLLIDMGAVVDGYCSDCTRTVAAGDVDGDAQEVYELVRSAQAAALEAIRAGVAARDADSVARDPIVAAGLRRALRPWTRARGGARGPRGADACRRSRIRRSRSATWSRSSRASIFPGRFGVRIEDLVTVTDDGCRNFSTFPKDLLVVQPRRPTGEVEPGLQGRREGGDQLDRRLDVGQVDHLHRRVHVAQGDRDQPGGDPGARDLDRVRVGPRRAPGCLDAVRGVEPLGGLGREARRSAARASSRGRSPVRSQAGGGRAPSPRPPARRSHG